MLKLFGTVMIISAFGIWGVSKSEKLKRRCDSLSLMISSLTLLENEIDYSQKDIAAALMSVGIIRNFPLFINAAKGIYKTTVQQAFGDAVKSSGICLAKSDREILTEFSQSLGTLEKDSQIGNIRHTKALFAAAKTSACEDYEKYGRLYRNMGFLLGILVSVLLF